MQRFAMITYSSYIALVLISCVRVCIQADVQCNTNPANGSVALCSAFSNQTVQLNCSVSNGIWFKNGCIHSVCQKSSCTLTDLSFNASSGLYFCQAKEPDFKEIFFLNLTVKAPPEFLPFPNHSLVHNSDGYYYPMVSVTSAYKGAFVNLKVRVVGVGPFNASWYHNNSQQEFCPPSGHNASVNCTKLEVTDQEAVFTLSLIAVSMPLQPWMAGLYSAVVTNEYGSNTSKINFQITCEQDPNENRIVSPLQYTTPLKFINQKNASLYCQVVVFHLADLTICYRYGNETSIDILKNNFPGPRCAVCPFDEYGSCNEQVEGKENWNVSQRGVGACNENRYVILNISKVTPEDDNITIFCGYHINAFDTKVLAEFDIIVAGPPFGWELFAFYALGGFILVIILTASIIIFMCYINQNRLKKKKKHRNMMRQKRSKQLKIDHYPSVEDSDDDDHVKHCINVTTSIPVPSSGTTTCATVVISSDPIRQPLLSTSSNMQGYGTAGEETDYPPTHIPNLSVCLNSSNKKV